MAPKATKIVKQADCDRLARNRTTNPLTGRKIKADGPTLRALLEACEAFGSRPRKVVAKKQTPPKSQPRVNAQQCQRFMEDPLTNPLTGRKIKKDGPTFKALAAACRSHKQVAATLVPLPSLASPGGRCQMAGLMQKSGTCYFNAPLNGLMLGDLSSRIYMKLIAGLTPSELAAVDAYQIDARACPMKPSRLYVLSCMHKFFSGKAPYGYGSRNNTVNRTKEIVNRFSPFFYRNPTHAYGAASLKRGVRLSNMFNTKAALFKIVKNTIPSLTITQNGTTHRFKNGLELVRNVHKSPWQDLSLIHI